MTHDDPSRAFWVLQGQQDKSGHRWGPADGAGHLPVPSQAPPGVRVCLSVTALRTEEPQGRTPMVSQTLRWDETFGEDVGGPDAGGRGVNLGARGQAAVDHISKNEHHGVSSPPGAFARDLATSRAQRGDLDRRREQSGGRCCVTSQVRPWVSVAAPLCGLLGTDHHAVRKPKSPEETDKAPGLWLRSPGHASKASGRDGRPTARPTPSHEKWSAYANRCAVVCYTAQTAELGNEVQPPQQVCHLLNFPVCLKMFKTKN